MSPLRAVAAVFAFLILIVVALAMWNSDLLSALLTLGFGAQVIRISVPYVFAALGGSITERAGMVDLALEAKLLFGAFTAAAVAHATNSLACGIAGGMAAGMAVAAVQTGLALGMGGEQVIVGIGLNILALGGTRFLLQIIFHEGANSPPCPALGGAVLANPLVWGAMIAAVIVPIALHRTRWGLRLRAAGDRPEALLSVGIDPLRPRLGAALVGGALTGAGGAQLSLAVGGFSADMSSGRGYIALAMVILAGWRPGYAALACVGVAIGEALNIQLQVTGTAVPRELASLLPYILTLLVLVVVNAKLRKPPAALGKQT
ncbi:MAG: inner-rane translocator [Myxococcales bacterium]|nr:inner-rane translocator [Myxococcales bacterium]